VKELGEGIQAGKIEKIRKDKLVIAEMPHDDKEEGASLQNKRITYRLQLRNAAELAGDITDQPATLENVEQLKQNLLSLQEKQEKVDVNWWNIKERKTIKRETEKKRIDLDIKAEKVKLMREIENKPVMISAFVVREYERGVLLHAGKFVGLIEPGLWEITPNFQNSSTEIIWVDMTEFQLCWGLSAVDDEVYTPEYARIGASGTISLQVTDAINLVLNVIASKKATTQDEIGELLNATIKSGLKFVLQKFKVEQLIRLRKEVEAAVRAELFETLGKWGLQITSVVVENLKLPEEFQDLLDERFSAGVKDEQDALEKKRTRASAEQQIEKLESEQAVKSRKDHLEWERKQVEQERKAKEKARAIEEEKMAIEHDLQKQELEVKRAKVAKSKAAIDRELKVDDQKTDIELEKERAISRVKVKEAEEAIKEIDKKRAHELELKRLEVERDIALAKKQPGEPRENLDTKRKQNLSRIAELELKLKQKEEKIDELDKLVMNEKITKDMYELRMKALLKETDEIKAKINVLEAQG
jgi:hypothetical protein